MLKEQKEFHEEIEPSFFELTFVMALDYFAEKKVDVAIIETGLGGRLDSTNVIKPLLSIITNVSFDHMDILGDTLEKIAVEKAGIIKENIPVIVGEKSAETKVVFEKKAKEMNAPIIFAEDNYKLLSSTYEPHCLKLEILDRKKEENFSLRLDLNGLYQEKNVLTVLAATDELRKHFSLFDRNTFAALAKVKKPYWSFRKMGSNS